MDTTIPRRLIAAALACILALGCTVALSGCASDEQVIREGITKELDAFKNPTKENLSETLSNMDSATLKTLESYGLDIYEFFSHVFRGFDYSVGDIAVNGQTATAKLTVTTIDVQDATQKAMSSVQNDQAVAAKVQELAEGGDQAQIMSYVFQLIYSAMDAEENTVTSDITLNLTKNGNEWTVNEDSMNSLAANMFGGLSL